MICLATGNYGTWSGTNKSITLRNADGATATMRVSLGSGDAGFTLDGLSGMGGVIGNGATNVTIRNSAFTSPINIGGVGHGRDRARRQHAQLDRRPVVGGTNAKVYWRTR